MLLDGRAQPTGIRRRGTDLTLLLILNAHHDAVSFKLPKVVGGPQLGGAWSTPISPISGVSAAKPFPFEHEYLVTGRSLLLFRLARDRSRNQAPASASP